VGNDGTDGERNGKLLNAYQKCSFAWDTVVYEIVNYVLRVFEENVLLKLFTLL
jgi:hypothetical protein